MDRRLFLGGAAFMLLGIAVSVGSFQLGLGSLRKPGTGFVPFIAGSVVALLSLLDVLKAFSSGKGEIRSLASLWKGLYWQRAAVIIFITSSYALLLSRTGFVVVTPFYVGLCMRVLGYRRWFKIGLTLVFSTLAFYLLVYCFELSIPPFPPS
jgi:hypothetical protein